MTTKAITDLLTAAAALFAAIASVVSAVKSSKAKTEAEQAKAIAQEIRTDIKTNVFASLSTVIRQTQASQQTQSQNIHFHTSTGGQGLITDTPIVQRGPEGPERLPEAPPDPEREEP